MGVVKKNGKEQPSLDEFTRKYGSTYGAVLFQKFGEFYITEGFLAEPELKSHSSPFVQGKMRNIQMCHDCLLDELSEFFQKYTFMALIGEARHARKHVAEGQRKGIGIAGKLGGLKRDEAWKFAWDIYHTHRLPRRANILRQLISLFSNKSWRHAYGGTSWGTIGTNLLNFWEGSINEKIFVDTAVTLAHNGDVYLDKLVTSSGLSEFKYLFTLKRKAPRVYDLLKRIREWVKRVDVYETHSYLLYSNVITPLYSEFVDYVTGGENGEK